MRIGCGNVLFISAFYKTVNMENKEFSNSKAFLFTVGDLEYTVTDIREKTVEVTGYVSLPEGKLEIPAIANTKGTDYRVTGIGYRAFCRCDTLTRVNIPDSVTSIGEQAFYGCDALQEVNIPDSVVHIEREAFAYCDTLTRITLGRNIASIGEGAFCCCFALTRIILPAGVKRIEKYAFDTCSALQEITVPTTVPPSTDSLTFENLNRNIRVYVPAEALETYRTAEGWKEFKLHGAHTGNR